MDVVSVNVGVPREIAWRGRTVTTGIFKAPVQGRIAVFRHNLEGDKQADLSVHGGSDKAVYAYPQEHYESWKKELPGVALPWGMFGENLTTRGLTEAELFIGDRLAIGSAQFTVTQPRMPCYKLGMKFGRDDFLQRFLASGRTGFYLSVHQEGALAAADPIAIVHRDPRRVSVADITHLYVKDRKDTALMRRAVAVPALPLGWKEHFVRFITASESDSGDPLAD